MSDLRRTEDMGPDEYRTHCASLEPLELALCESERLVLRVGRPYVFIPHSDCPRCVAMFEAAKSAYGPNGG